jgi:hypothetical protein
MASPRAPMKVAHGPPRALEWARHDVALEVAEARATPFAAGFSATSSPAPPADRPALLALLPTAATIAAVAIALALALLATSGGPRERAGPANSRGADIAKAVLPATGGGEEFV